MNNQNNTVQKKSKKPAIIFLVTVLALGIVSGAVLVILEVLEKNKGKEPTNQYSDELHSYIFYTPDYDLDVTTVDEYMELDRMLYYKYGSQEFGIDGNAEDFGDPVVFFVKYFETVIAGEWEEYNTFFTEHYYESNEPEREFAPQMIYDMHIEKLWEDLDSAEERYAFDVSYRIYRNNGTFRNDIDSGAAKTLYFELVNTDEGIKIDRITYYV